jgi:Tfp pilus assembly protein PilO
MRFRILDFGFSILVWLGLGSAYEAVFSQNAIKTTTIEQQSLRHDLTSKLVETSFDILNDIELDDLESIINKFTQGLPSDTEFSPL